MAAYRRLRHPMTGDIRDDLILRDDGAHIPADPANRDWQAYMAWLEAGNAPADADGAPTSAAIEPRRTT